jgi:uncharacterized protein YeaO (DUF488 family)
MIKTKSVYSSIEKKGDGLRILVTRLRGRGMPSALYDVWMANLGPSQQLLDEIRCGKIIWAEFKKRYRAELFEGGTIDRRNPLIKNHGQKFTLRLPQELSKRGHVTLMCHCGEDQQHCHRHLLAGILNHKIG